MLTSRDRILTTHCGSLPRPPQLSDMLLRQEATLEIEGQTKPALVAELLALYIARGA